jgi:hypothetical protein
MPKFRKKPVVIEAVQWTGSNVNEMLGFALTVASLSRKDHKLPDGVGVLAGGILIIETLEGDMQASPNDWIIKGVKGEFYPCKPDIFAATYEAVEE